MTNPLYDALLGGKRGSASPFLRLMDGTDISYGAFAETAGRLAAVLGERGVRPGDRVAVQAPKTPAVLALYLACVQTGAVFLPLNTAYTPAEIEYFLKDAAPSLFVFDGRGGEALQALCGALGIAPLTLDAEGGGSLADAARQSDPLMEVTARAPGDIASILYTSGTTGRSKGAMLSQDNLLSNALTLAESWRFTDRDILVHALPIYHTHGLFVASNVLMAVGGRMVFHPSFDADAVIDALPGATALMGVPTFYTRLLASERLTRAATRSMRLFISGSAPLLAETHRAFEARTGHRILERYGMTETSMTTSNPYDGTRKAGTVGFALPGIRVRVADAAGRPLPEGEIGVLEVKGPNVFTGYWNKPDKTAEAFRPDGYFITGDLSRVDKDGYVAIVGRESDMIISGGLNVYPKEIEAEIDAVPGVTESAVIGVPHPDFGEAVVAVIAAEHELDIEPIEAALAEKLARFKHPKAYKVIDSLPRNSMGKVQKARLREAYKSLFAPW